MASKRSKATRRAESQAAAERAAAIRAEQERLERRRRSVWVSVAVLAVLALIGGIFYAVQSSRDTTGETATPPAGAVDTYAVPVGPADAPVTVEVYEDFMCPVCGQFESASRSWLQEYADAGKVRVNYLPIAILDRASNGTDYSTRAASAYAVVLDSAGPEVAQKFHDLLFENQPEEGSDGLSDGTLVDLAVEAGADEGEVRQPIEDRAYEQWVANATDAASKRDGFEGTPSVFVDGEALTGFTSIEDISVKLKAEVDAKQ